MSSLSYLNEYGADSDENDSESKRLVLPSPRLSGINTVPVEEHNDDPLEHEGRVRSFQHVRGNWATYVHVKYPTDDSLLHLIAKLKEILKPIENINLCEDIHISLSKTVVLQYHMISTFHSSLKDSFLNFPCFDVGYDSIKVYCNEDKSRTFVALTVDFFAKKYLLQLTEKVDTVLKDFKLPTFYKEPSFHLSVVWTVGDKADKINTLLKQSDISALINKCESNLVEEIYCKIGHKLYKYTLD